VLSVFHDDETVPGIALEQALEGKKPRREPGPSISPWPGEGSTRARTSRGEQSFEAGVPAANRRARRARDPAVAVGALCGAQDGLSQRSQGNVVTASASGEPARASCGKEVGAARKAVVKPSGTPRRAAVEREPAWKQTARESGHGSSRGAKL
jgi:hypothetical protein